VIAGTATAGIPWAAWVAEKLKKPMAYIRGEKKAYGAGKQVEGACVQGKKTLIVEDLISTGGSSFSAVEAARNEGADVCAVVAIFTYEFKKAEKKFSEGGCRSIALCTFSTLAKVAGNEGLLSEEEMNIVLEWNKAPAEWGPKHGFLNAEPKA
jgi:orotate phosphoribosyltransferase